ncbi:unnamed protein product [Orchesella dallaii]|uniref:Uncharacterized protein n=1 Tax=Orchesella dallaii TaxID=48710 RepID=A0ABP1RND3_9HEXA
MQSSSSALLLLKKICNIFTTQMSEISVESGSYAGCRINSSRYWFSKGVSHTSEREECVDIKVNNYVCSGRGLTTTTWSNTSELIRLNSYTFGFALRLFLLPHKTKS